LTTSPNSVHYPLWAADSTKPVAMLPHYASAAVKATERKAVITTYVFLFAEVLE
jgi:hypothetical protein